MKIIFLSNSSWNIYNFRMPIIKEFISRNHQIIILSPLDSYADKLKELGCEVIDIKFKANKISPIGDFIYLINSPMKEVLSIISFFGLKILLMFNP